MMSQRNFILHDSSNEKEKALCIDILRACLKNSYYDFVAGGIGRNFFDIDMYDNKEDFVELWMKMLNELRKKGIKTERLAFIERDSGPIGMLTYKDFLEAKTQLETCCIRPRKRLVDSALKGHPLKNDEQVVLISDVATSGDSILDAAEKIWQLGGKVSCAVVFYDRSEGAREFLAQYDIDLFSILSQDQSVEDGYIEQKSETSAKVMQFVGVGITS